MSRLQKPLDEKQKSNVAELESMYNTTADAVSSKVTEEIISKNELNDDKDEELIGNIGAKIAVAMEELIKSTAERIVRGKGKIFDLTPAIDKTLNRFNAHKMKTNGEPLTIEQQAETLIAKSKATLADTIIEQTSHMVANMALSYRRNAAEEKSRS